MTEPEFLTIVLISAGVGFVVPLLMFALLALLSGPNIRVIPSRESELKFMRDWELQQKRRKARKWWRL